jgi:hypothetical protein
MVFADWCASLLGLTAAAGAPMPAALGPTPMRKPGFPQQGSSCTAAPGFGCQESSPTPCTCECVRLGSIQPRLGVHVEVNHVREHGAVWKENGFAAHGARGGLLAQTQTQGTEVGAGCECCVGAWRAPVCLCCTLCKAQLCQLRQLCQRLKVPWARHIRLLWVICLAWV